MDKEYFIRKYEDGLIENQQLRAVNKAKQALIMSYSKANTKLHKENKELKERLETINTANMKGCGHGF